MLRRGCSGAREPELLGPFSESLSLTLEAVVSTEGAAGREDSPSLVRGRVGVLGDRASSRRALEGDHRPVYHRVLERPSLGDAVCPEWGSVQFSRVRLLATPWTAARQASLSITNSWSPPKPMSIVSVMPSNHLILRRPLLLPSVFPSIRVFSNESALRIRWPKDWSFSFNISPSNEHPGLISF